MSFTHDSSLPDDIVWPDAQPSAPAAQPAVPAEKPGFYFRNQWRSGGEPPARWDRYVAPPPPTQQPVSSAQPPADVQWSSPPSDVIWPDAADDTSLRHYPHEFVKGAIEGGKNLIASTLKGFALPSEQQRIEERAIELAQLGVDPFDAIKQAQQEPVPLRPAEEYPLYRAGQAIEGVGKDSLAPRPGFEGSWTRDIGGGFGSLGAGVGAAILTGAGPAAGMFLGAGRGEALDRAIRDGATIEEAERAMRLGTIAGATDMVDALLPALGSTGKALGFIQRVGTRAIFGALAEGGQEGLQQLIQNAIARGIYKPEQDLFEDVPRNAAIGMIVGGTTSGALAAARPSSRGANESRTPVQPDTGLPAGAIPADVIFPTQPGAEPAEPLPEPSREPAAAAQQEATETLPARVPPRDPAAVSRALETIQWLPQEASAPDRPATNAPADAAAPANEVASPTPPTPAPTRDIDGAQVAFPDNDHAALFDFGQRIRGGEPVHPEEARRLLDAFRGWIITDPAVGEQFENWRDVGAAALTYFDQITEAAAAGDPVEAHDVIEPDLAARWYRARAGSAQPSAMQAAHGLVELRPEELTIDAKRFQYKGNADEAGVTGALRGIEQWDDRLANPILAWQARDGRIFVANGHQRTDLAKRAQAAGQSDIRIPGRIYREADGYTPEYMRALGAFQNIAEGTGTAVDAAKILRANIASLDLPPLPPRSALVQDARALASLGDDAFGMVVNDLVPAAYAAQVGRALSDPAEQLAAMDVLAKASPANVEQARIIVEDIRQSGFLRGEQTGLFGDEEFARSLVAERARILDAAIKVLRRTGTAFKTAVEQEGTLAAAGNVLSRDANVKAKSDNERLAEILRIDGTRQGPISTALSEFAKELAEGKRIGNVVPRFLSKVRSLAAGYAARDERGPAVDSDGPPGATGEGLFSLGRGRRERDLGTRAFPSYTLDELRARVESVSDPQTQERMRAEIAARESGASVPRVTPQVGAPRPITERVELDRGQQGDQYVIPGAERSRQGDVAQRRADQPLRPKKPQRPADEGLFSDDKDQGSLFSLGQSAPWYFSAVERAVERMPQAKASPAQWIAAVRNLSGTKPEEMEWLGLVDWLRGQRGPVTKQAMLGFIRANQIGMQEIERGDNGARNRDLLLTLPGPFQHGRPSVVATIRANDHVIDGKRALFMELIRVNESQELAAAPHKTTWLDLTLKRVLRWAAAEGYPQIAWTLSRAHKPGNGFYDRELVAKANALGRNYGAHASRATIETGPNQRVAVHTFPITPALADIAAGDGFPLFSVRKAAPGDSPTYRRAVDDVRAAWDNLLAADARRAEGQPIASDAMERFERAVSDVLRLQKGNQKAAAVAEATDAVRALRERAEAPASRGVPPPPDNAKGMRFNVRRDLTPNARKLKPQLERLITSMVRHIAGEHVNVAFDPIIDLPRQPRAWGSYARGRATAAGVYVPADRLIRIALADPRYRHYDKTAVHEAFHAVEHLLLTDSELNTLKKADAELREIVREYAHLTERQANELADFEVRAIAFEAYVEDRMSGDAPPTHFGPARAIFEKLRRLFERIRAMLNGRGFHKPDDVFSKIYEGRMAERSASPRMIGEVTEREQDDYETDSAPRYSLKEEREAKAAQEATPTQAARIKVMNRMDLRPIDRALRIPFDVFGGTNQKGEWKPGLYLSDRAEQIIKDAEFNSNGRFAFINPILERARRGLIDRYGLDPQYVERERRRGLDERAIMTKIPEIMETLRDANVGPVEARALQAILTGEKLPDSEWAKISQPIREAIDQYGQEAVELGLLSPEAYQRHRGSYMHRVYLKHETDASALARWAGSFMGRRRQKIIGDQFHGRGMWIEVSADKIGGNPQPGEKVRVLDKVQSDDGTVAGGDPATRARATHRAFVREGAAVPKAYANYRPRGTWTVRGKRNGQIVLWRDYTKDERQRMGEILDARYTIAKTFMLLAHDLSVGRFYSDISQNADWATSEPPAGEVWKEPGEYNRMWGDPSVQWVKVPDSVIPHTQTPRYGKLAGMYVRAEIWRDLQELESMQSPRWWDALLTQWKLNKTARSPVVHTNNIVSNALLMDMADVRAQDLARGIASLIRGDKSYQEAAENGAFGSDMVSVEIRRTVLTPILEQIEEELKKGDGTAANIGIATRLAEALWSKGALVGSAYGAAIGFGVAGPAGAAIGAPIGAAVGAAARKPVEAFDRKMVDMYRLEDEVFRMATYLRRRSQGANAEQAAIEARDQFMNYDIRAPWVNAARRTVLPFVAYTYRAVPIIARTVATRPWKLAKYFTLAYGLNALAYALLPGDEDRERRSMRDQERGNTWIGAPRMIRLPWADDQGNPAFIDIRRWIPGGDVFDMQQSNSAVAVPAPLQLGGPLMLGAELMLNRQAFTGRDIVNNRSDDWWDKTAKVGDWAWKAWMPSAAWVPGSWYWEKIGGAAVGARDWQGTPYSLPQAVASSAGIKVKPQDMAEGFAILGRQFARVERDLQAEARQIARDRALDRISEAQFQRRMEQIIAKREKNRAEQAERMR